MVALVIIWLILVFIIWAFIYGASKVKHDPLKPDESSHAGRYAYLYDNDDDVLI